MRRNLLLLTAFLTIACVQVYSAVTVEQMTEPDYVMNNGYSEAAAEEISMLKNRVNGKPAEPLYEKHNKFVRFCRNLMGYIDPAQDTDERIHHDIHMSPNFRDY